ALGTRRALAGDPDAPPGRAASGRSATAWRLAGDVLVVAFAAAALFELSTDGVTSSSGTSVSALAALAPGLVALALGVLGARLLPVALRVTHRRSAGSSRIGAALATRTVARRREFAAQVMLVALAVGLATFAVSGWVVASRNRTMRSEYSVGAAKVLAVSVAPGTTFLHAVRAADPSGHDAMAAVVELAGDGTTLAVDAPRLADVALWPSTVGIGAAQLARRLVPSHVAPIVTVSGSALRVRADTTALQAVPAPYLSVTVFNDDFQTTTEVSFGGLRPGTHTYRAALDGACGGGCRVSDLTLHWTPSGTPHRSKGATASIVVRGIGEKVAGKWRPVAAHFGGRNWRAVGHSVMRATHGGLAFSATLGMFGTTAGAALADVPIAEPTVVTPDTHSTLSGHGGPIVVGLDGNEVDGHTVAEIPAIPNVGTDAVLVNLQTADRYLTGSSVDTTTQVWLSQSAPPDIVGRLEAHGITVLTVKSAAAAERSLSRSDVSLAYLLFLIAAVAGCALAVAGTAFAISSSARRHEQELAALRAVGVGTPLLARYLRTEQWVALGAALVLGIAAGVLSAAVALRSLPELSHQTAGLPLDLGIPVTALAVTVGLVVAALVVTVVAGARFVVAGATPDRLGAS
ncbi:MAG: FtsX-like permease family protein, partial [Acidimicrobiales bacterium]